MRRSGPLCIFALLAACGGQPPSAPLPRPEPTPAMLARLATHRDPATWEDLDPSRPGTRRRDPRTGLTFALVPKGEFRMGSDDGAGEQRPMHLVRLTRDRWLATTELTIGQWQQHVREFAGDPNVPVPDQPDNLPMPLACSDAVAYCELYGYRLPTEAEWEYACTGGVPRDQEPWRDEAGMREYAWFHRNSELKSHPVGTRQANAFGLHDMLGSLWEWCAEDWQQQPYVGRGEVTIDPVGPSTPTHRVIRGGSWFSVPPATPRTRLAAAYGERSAFFGCRPAVSPP